MKGFYNSYFHSFITFSYTWITDRLYTIWLILCPRSLTRFVFIPFYLITSKNENNCNYFNYNICLSRSLTCMFTWDMCSLPLYVLRVRVRPQECAPDIASAIRFLAFARWDIVPSFRTFPSRQIFLAFFLSIHV